MLSPGPQSSDSSPERPIHPELRRQKNRESFSSATSIQAQKANSKDPYAGIKVTTEILFLLLDSKMIRCFMSALQSHKAMTESIDPCLLCTTVATEYVVSL